jgi:hypothetical protein
MDLSFGKSGLEAGTGLGSSLEGAFEGTDLSTDRAGGLARETLTSSLLEGG